MPGRAADRLFADGPEDRLPEIHQGPGSKRERSVDLNPELLASARSPLHRPSPRQLARPSSRLGLNLFPDLALNAVIERTEYREANRFVARGVVPEIPGSLLLFAADGDSLAASMFVPGRGVFRVQRAPDGRHRVIEVDPDSLPPCGPAGVPPPEIREAGNSIPEPGSPPTAPVGDGTPPVDGDANVIDVMVVYTAAARAGAGGVSGIQALIDLAVAEANTCYANSGIQARLNLVHRAEVAYTETGNANTDLGRLASPADGQLDSVHALRSQYGADIVTLLTESMASYAGLGYVMAPASSGFAAYAFNVVRRVYATGQFVYAHELGHNLGCAHDRQNSSSAGAYSYSYGYRFQAGGTQYRTVMAYAPGTRIPYFSNPSVSYNGAPTGVAAGSTAADNARTINQTAPLVANFRGTVTLVSLAAASRTVNEDVGSLTFEATRSGGTNGTVTVLFSTANGTATAGTDYGATNGTWTFAPGETVKSATVAVLDNATHEGQETFQFRLTSPIGAALGTATTTVTVNDDDRSTVSFTSANRTVFETNATLAFPVVRAGNTSTEVTVRYATVAETATAGSDYTAITGTLTFAAGETNKTLSVAVRDDAVYEAAEVFHVRLSNPGNTALGSYANTKVTLRESDRSVVRLGAAIVNAQEREGVARVSIRRDTPTNNLVTVRFATVNGTALAGTHYLATNGTVVFEPGVTSRTIVVPLIDNDLLTGNKAFSMRLSHPFDATLGLTTNTVLVLDDEISYVGFTLAKRWFAETAGTVAIAVARSGSTNRPVSVRYGTVNGTATAGRDYGSATGTLAFAAGETNKTITLTLLADTAAEPDESFYLRLSSPSGTSLGSITNLEVVIRQSVAGALAGPSEPSGDALGDGGEESVFLIWERPDPEAAGMGRVRIRGPAGTPFLLQATDDLEVWIPVETNVLGESDFVWTAPLVTNAPRRFHRVVSPAAASDGVPGDPVPPALGLEAGRPRQEVLPAGGRGPENR